MPSSGHLYDFFLTFYPFNQNILCFQIYFLVYSAVQISLGKKLQSPETFTKSCVVYVIQFLEHWGNCKEKQCIFIQGLMLFA